MCQAVCDIDESNQSALLKKKIFPLDCGLSTTETFEFVSW